MPVYYAVGGALVAGEEYEEKVRSGAFAEAMEDVRRRRKARPLEFTGRTVPAEAALAEEKTPGNRFTPIAYGKPLAVELRWIYTGDKPSSLFGGARDMLATSAFKSIATFNEAPRAVNLLSRKVKPFSNVGWGGTVMGTPIAFYTPAVAEPATFATFEVLFDDFPDDTITKFGGAVTAAAGIPVFAAQSVYLLAAGSLLKLLAGVGHTLFDGQPAFRATEQIAFTRPGSEPTPAGWRILTQQTIDDDELLALRVGTEGQLLDGGGRPYAGKHPYIVISLDGAPQDAYREFTPTAASAALLDRFFAIKEGQMHPVEAVVEGLKLYSDLSFRMKAEKLQKELARIDSKDARYAKKKAELDALKENIVRDELKLPAGE